MYYICAFSLQLYMYLNCLKYNYTCAVIAHLYSTSIQEETDELLMHIV